VWVARIARSCCHTSDAKNSEVPPRLLEDRRLLCRSVRVYVHEIHHFRISSCHIRHRVLSIKSFLSTPRLKFSSNNKTPSLREMRCYVHHTPPHKLPNASLTHFIPILTTNKDSRTCLYYHWPAFFTVTAVLPTAFTQIIKCP